MKESQGSQIKTMGMQQVSGIAADTDKQSFVRALLRDMQALDYMIEHQCFETDVTRIGAEQEMFLVDSASMKPAPINQQILTQMGHPSWLKPELAKFNLETNLTPRELTGLCFRQMEMEGLGYLQSIRREVRELGADIVLTGVLPTLNRHDLDMHNLTPNARYRSLLDATKDLLHDDHYKLHITGIDELVLSHRSSLLPASSNSFQVHLQVDPAEFARYYNFSLLLAAPVLAVAANSPLVFGKRLWQESRMVLYQQASDTRACLDYQRDRTPRVHFADRWLEHGVAELYQDDISRFKVLLGDTAGEDSLALAQAGKTPALRALQVHNSTVYRWNRPCYGISPNGRPHLRIENRMIPAGPSVADQVANAAFWIGCMVGLADNIADVRSLIGINHVQDNFWKAAKHGADAELVWLDKSKFGARELILDYLLPLARNGLHGRGVAEEDVERYLGVIRERASLGINGASWMLGSFNRLREKATRFEALAALTADTIDKQWRQSPVHTWPLAGNQETVFPGLPNLQVEDFMQTELHTVHPDDPLELAAAKMDWNGTDCLAVDDHCDRFMGVITRSRLAEKSGALVRDRMLTRVALVSPHGDMQTAIELLRESRIDYLPVVAEGKLVGVLRRQDLRSFGGMQRNDARREKGSAANAPVQCQARPANLPRSGANSLSP